MKHIPNISDIFEFFQVLYWVIPGSYIYFLNMSNLHITQFMCKKDILNQKIILKTV